MISKKILEKEREYSIFKGDWKNDKFDGKGIFYFNDGERYEGDFKNNKFDGKGKFHYKNGNRYEGDWKNDKK